MKHFQQGRALVIGVGSFHDPRWDTATATRDAQGCYAALIDPAGAGYARSEVELLLDAEATRRGVGMALERLADRCTPESVVFISITSHGALGDDNLYYLATSDAQFTEPGDQIRKGSGFSVADLARALRAISSRQVLVVVNACFAGHLGPRLSQGTISADAAVALPDEASKEILATGEGRAIISASKPEQRSYYDPDAIHSYFGQALIQALESATHRPESATRRPESATRRPESATRRPESANHAMLEAAQAAFANESPRLQPPGEAARD